MRLLIFLVLFLRPQKLTPSEPEDRWIVWNVGQGSWATVVQDHACRHFDAGGEHAPGMILRRACAGKDNLVFFSHADWDHIAGLKTLRSLPGRLCIGAEPPEKILSARKRSLLAGLPRCATDPRVQELQWPRHGRRSNDQSRVFVADERLLFPGDSPAAEEALWARKVPSTASILVLGHHGSRGSTSEFLLRANPQFRLAIASARAKKYGHPHAEVIARLRNHHLPLLKTESWGHLIFQL